MSKSIRSLAVGFSKSVTGLLNESRRQARLPIDVSLEVRRAAGNLEQSVTVKGHTVDLGKSGLSFVVPVIRVGEHYLVSHGEAKPLKLSFDLPGGAIRLTVLPTHYEMIELHNSVQQYVVGTRITAINEGDRERYEHFLAHGEKALPTEDSAADFAPAQKKSLLSGFLSIF